ncbi:XRE family transcriptional regulator [Thalassotalea sp. HSM 43]|uniref:helix-turn-helix domain-containing protein n=1 Tax=Thalassotalea sp. HSM 43 TaxID=2552945 RepID=UPI0010818F2D|nr:helix-turn-helix transcriptional regulator [Thalassotalea sp. HSM 43]QBY03479.1 XRE family transcriptional regulator [Thalassotalea sp. HSM 43]
MSQTTTLLVTLKKALKAHGFTYADVAKHMDLSQASIKRLFSEENFSLQRLEQICQLMDMQISDLVKQMSEQQARLQQLSVEQETEITNDIALLLVAVCVLNKWRMQDIVDYYQMSEPECIGKLTKLDKLKIIELLPGNRIKLLVDANFGWLENGPIQTFFQRTIGQEFFNSSFHLDDECLIVLNGMLSLQSNGEFQRKLRRLAREFEDLNHEDSSLSLTERNGATVVLAIRNWRYGLSRHLVNNGSPAKKPQIIKR